MHATSIWAPCSGCPCPNHHLPSCIFTVEPSLSDDPEWMHLARSNNIPSQQEETVLSGMISTYDQHIKDIDTEKSNLGAFSLSLKAQIVAVSQRMDALRQERVRVTEAVRERHNLLSPVRRLPSEILNHIFLDTIDFPVQRMQITQKESEEAAALHIWKFDPTENSLWSITGVSKKWRSASLSSPRLWSYINIIITESNFDDHSYIRQLGLQLDRSAKYPLSISICRVVRGFERIALPPQLVAILFSFSSCIRELHLYLDVYLLSQMSDMRLSLPSLEYLVLRCQSNGVFDSTPPHLRLFSSTPKLQSLEVIDWNDRFESFEIPWNQIKKYHNDHRYIPTLCDFFRLHGPQAHHHLNALRKFQQMEECTLRLSGVSDTLDFGGDVYPLICPQLRVLELSSWSIDRTAKYSAFRQVAKGLVLPALSVLKVACSQRDSYEGQDVFSSICDLLQRSQSPITVLHFDHGRVLTEDLLQFFRSTPTLEDLRLTRLGDAVFTKEVMEKLTVDHASSELVLPRLRTLYIPGERFKIADLVRLVQSRRSSDNSRRVDRLQTFRLCGNFPDPCPSIDAIISRLKQYYAEGFSFSVCRTVL